MKKAKAARVPVLENAFEVNLPKLLRIAKATGSSRLLLDDGDVRTVVMLTVTHLAVFLGGRPWVVDIVPVQCLKARVRPLLKCPRAHEGNFQSLYYRGGELACRRCQGLRYASTLAPSMVGRERLARHKLIKKMGGEPGEGVPMRNAGAWRKKHARQIIKLGVLMQAHYEQLRAFLGQSSQVGA
ncbi:hypothetical protein [Massilia horti]|uniref:Uncharacterized protein n=1 Tax=Massilia horti TaxID=2562153 RepID=A0A4Y9T2G3_9BURK|nr:hypothetical protein [Massilia horti]TFW33597.1 hypothetical protein E4O92_06280 [Massilia horti]